MARLEAIRFHPHLSTVTSDNVTWAKTTRCRNVERLPQIFWSNGTPWREANLWAYERAVDDHKESRTVLAGMTALFSYAQWLEKTGSKWWDFPDRKKDRCLVRFRSTLINAREEGDLAPSTVSERMRVVISFYRWLKGHGLLSTNSPMWRDRVGLIKWADNFGMERTLRVLSSELSIPNRKIAGDGPEAGLFPVATIDRDALLMFAMEHGSEELFLLLSLGFFTGMRLGTLADLKVSTLANAVPDARCNDLYRLALGPGARPPVATKFGVSGNAFIPRTLLDLVREYTIGTRRLLREAKAESTNRSLVFLTKYGNAYAQRGVDKSVAINVEMWSLRKKASAAGIEAAKRFWFHQTRATFGTELARIALKYGNTQEAVSLVKEALLQRDESSALHYIRFVEKTPIKIEVANEFTRSFLGLFGSTGGKDALRKQSG